MQLNTQPIERISNDCDIEVIGLFPTIQGEGPFAGMPALFVRLAGCNWFCSRCDTDYTTGRRHWTINALQVSILSHLAGLPTNLVVITGGEPFRQTSLAVLIRSLLDPMKRFDILCQVESNGTLYFDLHPNAVIVCSPKTGSLNKRLAEAMRMSQKHCFKYVLDADHVDETDGLPTSVLGQPVSPARPPKDFPLDRIYLQPADHKDEEQNKRNLDAVVASCLKYGYRLNLQMHKIAGLP